MGIVKGALAQSNALDDSQADRYYPDSRMTLSIIKNRERKEVNAFMELKHVIPNMEKTFGNLEFAGENKVCLLYTSFHIKKISNTNLSIFIHFMKEAFTTSNQRSNYKL